MLGLQDLQVNNMKEMMENEDGPEGRGQAWAPPKGLGRISRTEVVLPRDSVLRTLSKCPKILKVRNTAVSEIGELSGGCQL